MTKERTVLAYPFLDPAQEGNLLAAYIVGITFGCCLVFSIVKGVCLLRRRMSLRYGRFEDGPASRAKALEEEPEMAVPLDVFPSQA